MMIAAIAALFVSGAAHCASWIWAVTYCDRKRRLVVAMVPVLWALKPGWLPQNSQAMRGLAIGSLLLMFVAGGIIWRLVSSL